MGLNSVRDIRIFSGPDILLPRVLSAIGPVARLEPHSCPVVEPHSQLSCPVLCLECKSLYGRLIVRFNSDLFCGGDAHSVWLGDLDKTVVSRERSRWCSTCVESEQASLNTTEVAMRHLRYPLWMVKLPVIRREGCRAE